MCSRKLKGRSALRAETRKRCCCSPFTIQGLTGYSPFRSRNVEKSFSGTQVHLGKKKKTHLYVMKKTIDFPAVWMVGMCSDSAAECKWDFFFFACPRCRLFVSLPFVCIACILSAPDLHRRVWPDAFHFWAANRVWDVLTRANPEPE